MFHPLYDNTSLFILFKIESLVAQTIYQGYLFAALHH
jgi:hypothetical protein